jgi:predicted alpha-1,6-mannanase (GH76 family)
VTSGLAGHATAAVTALQDWYDWDTGLWAVPGSAGWWNSANALYALVDYMSVTGTDRYLDVVENTFARNCDGGFLNDFYDDEGWWALAWIHACDLLDGRDQAAGRDHIGQQAYLEAAQAIFADMETGWDAGTCEGGVIWKKGGPGKNSIENELFLAVAARLYQRSPAAGPQRAHYLEWIGREGEWFHRSFIAVPGAGGLIYDGLASPPSGPCTHDGHQQTFTYTQGVILGALADLDACGLAIAGHEPLPVATQIADAAIARLSSDGILTEYGPDFGQDYDLPQFKGIFMRNLARLAECVGPGGNAGYVSYIRRNADSVVASDCNDRSQFGYRWQGPFDEADAVRQTSALEALNAALRAG